MSTTTKPKSQKKVNGKGKTKVVAATATEVTATDKVLPLKSKGTYYNFKKYDISSVYFAVKTHIVRITPILAEMLLANSDEAIQRLSDPHNVFYLARQMEESEWVLNGEAVTVSIDGDILNGMHRLQACIKSGEPFDTILITGLPKSVIATYDQAKRRTFANLLEIKYNRPRYSVNIAAAVQFIYHFKNSHYAHAVNKGGNVLRRKLPPKKFLQWVDDNKEIFEFTADAIRKYNKGSKLLTPKIYVGLKWVLDGIDKEMSDKFFNDITKPESLQKGTPIFALYHRLAKYKTSGNLRQFVTHWQLLNMCINCFNLMMQGVTQGVRRIPATNKIPEIIRERNFLAEVELNKEDGVHVRGSVVI